MALFGRKKQDPNRDERMYHDMINSMTGRSDEPLTGGVPVRTFSRPLAGIGSLLAVTIASGRALGSHLDLQLECKYVEGPYTINGGFAYITKTPQAVWIDYQDVQIDRNLRARIRMDWPIYDRDVPQDTVLISAWIEVAKFADGSEWINPMSELEADRCRDTNMVTWRRLGLR